MWYDKLSATRLFEDIGGTVKLARDSRELRNDSLVLPTIIKKFLLLPFAGVAAVWAFLIPYSTELTPEKVVPAVAVIQIREIFNQRTQVASSTVLQVLPETPKGSTTSVSVATTTPSIPKPQKPRIAQKNAITNELELEIRRRVTDGAVLGGADPDMALFYVEHESHFNPKADGDNDLICNLPKSPNFGKQIHSRGIFQINDCAWPEVTNEQAFDVNFSIAWAIPKLKTTPEIWTAYKLWKQITMK